MNENIAYFVSFFSLGFLLVIVLWLYRDYRVDLLRQRMFELRDKMFDEASGEDIGFDSSAYGMLRSTMNGMIRFAHRLSLLHILAINFAMSTSRKYGSSVPFSTRFRQELRALPKHQRDILSRYHAEMNVLMVRHVLLSSPIVLVTVIIPLALTFRANSVLRKLSSILKAPIDRVDRVALSEGQQLNGC